MTLTASEYEKPDETPALIHPDIDEDTADKKRAKLKAEQVELTEAWWARLGWIEGTGQNIQEALDEKYYQQLGHTLLKYKKVKPKEYLNYLANKWCRLYTKIKKELKEAYSMPWCQTKHIMEFAKDLDKGQEELLEARITLSNEEKL